MSETKSRFQVDMLHGSITKALLIFAIPVLISGVFQQLYSTVDTMVLGYVLGDSAVASVGAVGPVYEMIIEFAVGIGAGLSIVTGRSFGTGDNNLLKKSVAYAVIIGIGTAILITLVFNVGINPLLVLLRTPESIMDDAIRYIRVIINFTIVTLIYNLCSGLLRAVGNSFMPLIFLIISSMTNVALDVVFVRYLGMGVAGAAYATAIAEGLSAVLCMIYLVKKCSFMIPKKEHFKNIDKNIFTEMLAQGYSVGMMSAIVSVGTVILQYGINGLGEAIITGHTIARKLFNLLIMPLSPVVTASTAFVSQNIGAWQWDRVRKCIRISNTICIVSMLIVIVIVEPLAPALVKLMSGSSDPEVISTGARYIRYSAPFYPVLGVLFVSRNALQAIGEKLLPLISSVIELIGKILFVVIIVPRTGYLGVIFCEPLIWVAMTAQLLWSLYHNEHIVNAYRKEEK